MRNFNGLCKIMLLASSVLASASQASELMIKYVNSAGGFMPVLYTQYNLCEIFSDKVVLTDYIGGPSFVETKNVKINDLQALKDINSTILTQHEKVVGIVPADAPFTTITVYVGGVEKVIVGTQRDDKVEVQSEEANAIKKMVARLCPNAK